MASTVAVTHACGEPVKDVETQGRKVTINQATGPQVARRKDFALLWVFQFAARVAALIRIMRFAILNRMFQSPALFQDAGRNTEAAC
jgi:hypothetical protein